jgi:3-methyladenine DNA glycosylase AlkD
MVEGSWTLVKTSNNSIQSLAREIERALKSCDSQTALEMRRVRREYQEKIALWPAELVIKLGLELIKDSKVIQRILAYELIHHHKLAAQSLNSGNLRLLGQGIDNWATVDTFACYLSGPAWRRKQISDSVIKSWYRSKDFWWRRAAIVSSVALNLRARGGSGDAVRTLAICQLAIDDHDDMVVKAMSWALRALSTRHPDAVEDFLLKNESHLASRVLREVRNKLRTGLKNPKSKGRR